MTHRIDQTNEEVSYCMFCRGKNTLCMSIKSPTRSIALPEKSDFNAAAIPENVLLHIFSFLGYKELLAVRCVSPLWKRIAEDRQLWRAINMSCKRIQENNLLFRLPKRICKQVKVVNLMWTYISIPAFKCVKEVFCNMEVLLLQYCKFSIHVENGTGFRKSIEFVSLPSKLKVLDVRNVQGSWFDDTDSISTLLNMEAMAFSQTMPSDWLSRLSTVWLPKLRVLNIQNNPCLSDVFLTGVVNNSLNLESLSIQGCMYVRGVFLNNAIKKLKNMVTLDLSGTRLEGRYIQNVDWENTKIKSLNISFCCKLFETDMKILLPKLKYLRHLQASFVGWGRAISNNVITETLTQSSLQLETLDIQSTFALSITSLIAICKRSTNLQHLRIGTIIKTEEELTWLLSNIPHVKCLSLQMGESNFTAPVLFLALSSKCVLLESLFIYNISFEHCSQDLLESSLETLFTNCSRLRNFFTGGYPYKQKQIIDKTVKDVITSLQLNINHERPVRIVPQPDACFDQYLCESLGKRCYNAKSLKETFQSGIYCQSFYKTGLQKLGENHFALLRT